LSQVKKRKKRAAITKKPPPGSAPPSRFPTAWVVGGVVAFGLIALIVSSLGPTGDATDEYGTPVVTGQALATHMDETPATDPTVGQPIPEVVGADWDGNEVSILRDGTAKAIVFLAHWCPHCQREVPAVAAYLDAAQLPSGLEILSVATSIDPVRTNYPPSAWLEREGWQPPVLMDDAASTVAAAFGLRAFPYWVFVDGNGNVVRRFSGETDPAALASWLVEAASA